MSLLIPALTVGGIFLSLTFVVWLERRKLWDMHQAVAVALGLTWDPGNFWSKKESLMSGTLGGFQVSVAIPLNSAQEFLKISFDDIMSGEDADERRMPPALPLRVTVDSTARKEGSLPPALKLERQKKSRNPLDPEDKIIGDPEFDARVRVGGGTATALAVLAPEARSKFLALQKRVPGLRVADGSVTAELPKIITRYQAQDHVLAAIRLAELLVLPADGIPASLARRAVEDDHPGVRLRALTVLAAGAPGQGMAEATARRLLDDPHPELRLCAAMALGEEGFEDLARIVRTPASRGFAVNDEHDREKLTLQATGEVPTEVLLLETAAAQEGRRARALGHLAAAHRRDRVLPLVKEALRASGPLHVAALVAVGKIGSASFEADAIAAIDSDVPQVRSAAIEALGAIGTTTAVPHLRALAGRSGPFNFDVRNTVDVAVTKIRSRLPVAAAGQVALAEGEGAAGQVSLAAAGVAGRVALPQSDS